VCGLLVVTFGSGVFRMSGVVGCYGRVAFVIGLLHCLQCGSQFGVDFGSGVVEDLSVMLSVDAVQCILYIEFLSEWVCDFERSRR